MLKNSKGVTILALVITILVLVILTGVSVNMGFSNISEIRVGRLIANMTMVKAKVETIYEENQFNNEKTLVGNPKTIDEFLSIDEITRIASKAGVSDISDWDWYEWGSNDLENQGLDKSMLSDNEYFYVNYENAEVIYSKGASLGGKTYYSLTGLTYILENN